MVAFLSKKLLLFFVLLTSSEVFSSVNSRAMPIVTSSNAQLVNLNLQIKSKNKTVNSDLVMPFYQTAELERKVGGNNILIELNPRRGKNPDEISLEMKFYNSSGTKAIFKKQILAKVNQESKISFRGMSVRVTPVLN